MSGTGRYLWSSITRLIGRLTERACHIIGGVRPVVPEYVVDGLGKSPVDFAFDVIELYLTEKL